MTNNPVVRGIRSVSMCRRAVGVLLAVLASGITVDGQSSAISGAVRDQTGAVLPGVLVELTQDGTTTAVLTDSTGRYAFNDVNFGTVSLAYRLANFAEQVRRDIQVGSQPVTVNVTLQLALSADLTVTGLRTFSNLADAERPAETLVGIADSASQGAITARQLETRPLMRVGEVLETVPGMV